MWQKADNYRPASPSIDLPILIFSAAYHTRKKLIEKTPK